MPRPPSIQWYYKQWLGDNKVLAMDWDAQAMHFHLLMISIQEDPSGSIPNDVCLIRRWLRLPSGQSDSDRVWARVQPQIFAAWTLQDERWINSGMVETCQRRERYAVRYETGTKTVREKDENHCNRSKEVFDLEVQSQKQESKPPKKQKASRVPEGFAVSEEMRAFAAREHLPDPDSHIAEFIDYWSSQPGQKGVKSDWPATFRNWLRRAPNFRGGGNGNGKLSFEERASKEREIAREYVARANR